MLDGTVAAVVGAARVTASALAVAVVVAVAVAVAVPRDALVAPGDQYSRWLGGRPCAWVCACEVGRLPSCMPHPSVPRLS